MRQGIVITGDGGFASGLRQGVEQVVGVQMPCQAVDVPDGMSTVGLSQSLAEACQRCDSGDGSSATAMSFWPKPIADGGRKMVLEREGFDAAAFRGQAQCCGRRGLTSLWHEGRCGVQHGAAAGNDGI
ncbi:PTS N-acetylgalactosamine transporter subunit IIA [Edwardsiella ictaluri]|nr:hypothetical protein B6E78_14520 [Edwardsiella ictaluri]AVZ84008.1 PTS N-acetylgalactosamine transporter subunit IIA [Edwardsiella ictaluri]EKS7762083.1 PTS N-acetylgalactosamine transporter subunit IIA [Edwardsiella ictaluri]EKS7768893.1 PTS N-acetylgalactosamine transporter subunit IIA [Edwardsiella ictaluri]EKS7771923.1 PTS N-acetylgalactosamine transporter subunit IIA [Edwardsiella ictaluri]